MRLFMAFITSLSLSTATLAAAPPPCDSYLTRGELLTPWMKRRWSLLDVRGQRTLIAEIHNFVHHRVEQRPLNLRDQQDFAHLLLKLFGDVPRIDHKTSKEIWIPWVLIELTAIPETHPHSEYELESILLLFDTYERDHDNRVQF